MDENLHKRFKLESPEAYSRDVIIDQMQKNINSLQRQIDALKHSTGEEMTDKPHLPWSEIDEAKRCYDLPSVEIVMFYVDLYYEYFHPNHCFLLPKKSVMRYVSFKADAALLHAMFAVACRFVTSHPDRCKTVDLQDYHKDPVYWVDLFQKHRQCMFTTPLIKALLLVGMAMGADNNLQRSADFADEAYQLCCWNNMDKRFSRTAEISNMNNKKLLQGFSTQQLLHRESVIRTVWEVWKFRVQIALFFNDPNMIPAFNGDMCLPLSDALYENELEGWDFKRPFWSDLDATLLDETAGQTSGNAGSEQGLYTGSSMHIVCVNLLALVFKHGVSMSPAVLSALEERLKMLYKKVPPVTGSKAQGQGYLMAHEALYGATLLLHKNKASPFSVFWRSSNLEPMVDTPANERIDPTNCYVLRDPKYVQQLLTAQRDQVDDEASRSYRICQWAAHCICALIGDTSALKQLLSPSSVSSSPSSPRLESYDIRQPVIARYGTEYSQKNLKFWRHMSPVTGFLLDLAIPFLASELVLQSVAQKLGRPVMSENPNESLAFPLMATTESAASLSISFGNAFISSSSNTAEGGSNAATHGSGDSSTRSSSLSSNSTIMSNNGVSSTANTPPFIGSSVLGLYGSIDSVGEKLNLLIGCEEVLAEVWLKMKELVDANFWLRGKVNEYSN